MLATPGSQQLQRAAPWHVEFISSEGVRAGSIEVKAEFRHQTDAKDTPGPTRAIKRHRSAFLVIAGERVRLTHTPFTIGRSPDCDLSIPDLAISRRHACIDVGDEGQMMVRDLASETTGRERRDRIRRTLVRRRGTIGRRDPPWFADGGVTERWC